MPSTVLIVGDSFSSSSGTASWTTLDAGYNVINVSMNGASQYRLMKKLRETSHLITADTAVILCHTNPYRVYVPDHVRHPARSLGSHPFSDMVMGDWLDKGNPWKRIAEDHARYLLDETQMKDIWELMLRSMQETVLALTKTLIHVTGFDCEMDGVYSFAGVARSHPGRVNHMDAVGNDIVRAYVSKRLENHA